MPAVICPDGHRFFVGEIPCSHQHVLIADNDIENLVTRIMEMVAKNENVEFDLFMLISSVGKDAYICPHCGRFLILDKNGHLASSFMPEQKS